MLETVNNLGALYADKSRLRDAEAMYMRALQGHEKALGANQPSTLGMVNKEPPDTKGRRRSW